MKTFNNNIMLLFFSLINTLLQFVKFNLLTAIEHPFMENNNGNKLPSLLISFIEWL